MRTQAEIQARLTEESANQFVRTLQDLANHPLVAIDAAMELHGGGGHSPFQVMRFSPAETPGESARLVPSIRDRLPRSKTAAILGENRSEKDHKNEGEDSEGEGTDSQRAGRVRRAVTVASGMEEKAKLGSVGSVGSMKPLVKQGSGFVRMCSMGSGRGEGLSVSPSTSMKSRQTAPPSPQQANLISARPLAAGPSWPLGNGNVAVEGSGNFTRASSRGSDVASTPVGSPVRSQSPPRHRPQGLRSRSPEKNLPLQPILSVSSIGPRPAPSAPRPAPSQLIPSAKGLSGFWFLG